MYSQTPSSDQSTTAPLSHDISALQHAPKKKKSCCSACSHGHKKCGGMGDVPASPTSSSDITPGNWWFMGAVLVGTAMVGHYWKAKR